MSDSTGKFICSGKFFLLGCPGGVSGNKPTCHCRRHKRCEFYPWVWKIPWRRAWKITPVFLPGVSHGQRKLGRGWGGAMSPLGHTESDMTEVT